MTRKEAINLIGWLKSKTNRDDDLEAIDMAIEALRHDVIFEQIKWERDVALDTLEEHGIGLGQKAEYIIPSGDVMFTSAVVRCKDCKWWNEDDFPRAFPEKKTSACECPNIYGANFSRYTQEDEFCSMGVRKGGGDE